MKNAFFFLLGIAFMMVLSIQKKSASKVNLAEVDRVHGLYIFAKSRPTADYEHLGEVKPGFAQAAEFDNLVENMVKRAKKEFPKANALIFDGSIRSYHNTKASAVILKEE